MRPLVICFTDLFKFWGADANCVLLCFASAEGSEATLPSRSADSRVDGIVQADDERVHSNRVHARTDLTQAAVSRLLPVNT
jgi:hypothetical protein